MHPPKPSPDLTLPGLLSSTLFLRPILCCQLPMQQADIVGSVGSEGAQAWAHETREWMGPFLKMGFSINTT